MTTFETTATMLISKDKEVFGDVAKLRGQQHENIGDISHVETQFLSKKALRRLMRVVVALKVGIVMKRSGSNQRHLCHHGGATSRLMGIDL